MSKINQEISTKIHDSISQLGDQIIFIYFSLCVMSKFFLVICRLSSQWNSEKKSGQMPLLSLSLIVERMIVYLHAKENFFLFHDFSALRSLCLSYLFAVLYSFVSVFHICFSYLRFLLFSHFFLSFF